MVFHIEYDRTVPERRPSGHQPAAPRNALRWTKPISAIISDYFAIQAVKLEKAQQDAFFQRARNAFSEPHGPDCSEIMSTMDEAGYTNAVVVAYWTDPVRHARWEQLSSLTAWLRDDDRLTATYGVWRETISVPYDRHETIYSENWYKIGIGRTENSTIVPITDNGYFGAARDRIPLSAIDLLESPYDDIESMPRAKSTVIGKGQRLSVRAPVNMVTLRSGQYWAHANGEQLDDYVENMQPRLMAGMDHLRTHKEETGTLTLRVLTNLDEAGDELRETSTMAHFLSMAHLEKWAASHKTHLNIYKHAIAMKRKYKEDRELVTWHELFVSVSATFEYVNCHPGSGLLPFIPAENVSGGLSA